MNQTGSEKLLGCEFFKVVIYCAVTGDSCEVIITKDIDKKGENSD
jgi:hypothetical protein